MAAPIRDRGSLRRSPAAPLLRAAPITVDDPVVVGMRRLRVALAVVTLVAVSALAVAVATLVRPPERRVVAEFSPNAPPRRGTALDVQAILHRVEPALVSVEVVMPPSDFDVPPVVAHGTGMVVDAHGHAVTNHHVIAGAAKITVRSFGSEEQRPARVVLDDSEQDIAVLDVGPAPALPPITFGDSGAVRVGDEVLAIGDALGLGGQPTVTSGIVSALGRSVPRPSAWPPVVLHDVIQVDAALNGGVSGGPIVDSAGRVVAMSTIVAATGENGTPSDGIGFAIPADRIRAVLAGS